MGQLSAVIATLEGYVGGLQPELLSGDDASRLVELFNRGSRLCAAGRALAARRAAEANAWKAGGYRSAEDWLAAKTKTSRAAAAEALATAERVENLPATKEALLSGQVSVEQASAIAAAATADPTAEGQMLAEAERSSLGGLQKTSRAVVAAASKSQAADRERIHRSRYLRHWTSADGAFEGRFRLTPDAGAVLLGALDTEKREVFAQAKADGRYESDPAYAADALVNLARNTLDDTNGSSDPDEADGDTSIDDDTYLDGDDDAGDTDTCSAGEDGDLDDEDGLVAVDGVGVPSAGVGDLPADMPPGGQPGKAKTTPRGARRARRRRGRTPPHVVNIRVDLAALLRGHTQAGEVCEAVGVGPVSVATAQHALCDAIIRLLNIKDGQVIDICNAGRTIPTKLAIALQERDRQCCIPDCDAARHLQNHHLHPVEFLGPTSLANLARVCPYHHEQITHQGAQLTGPPDNWTWHPPGTNIPHPVNTSPAGTPPSNTRNRAAPPCTDTDLTLALDLG
jgi:hypothetical protein